MESNVTRLCPQMSTSSSWPTHSHSTFAAGQTRPRVMAAAGAVSTKALSTRVGTEAIAALRVSGGSGAGCRGAE
jgi:hypothetical protein